MTPLTDPRPFAEVLRDWMERHGLTAYRAAIILAPVKGKGRTGQVPKWLAGTPPAHERGMRALMTLHDEGRV